MKYVFAILLSVTAGVFSYISAQDLSLYQKYKFIQNGDTLPYRILLPENFDARKRYPLVLFLHGRGESGQDNEKQLIHGATLFLQSDIRKKFPAIVVFPQNAFKYYWSNVQMVADTAGKRQFYFVSRGEASPTMKLAMALVRNVFVQYKIKKDQVYVMGLSMGAMGTFEIANRMPKTFAAAVPICGGADTSTAKNLAGTQWWIFHGAKDDVVQPRYSEQMADALKKYGAQVRFTLYPEANHNSWDAAFAEPELLPWLFSRRLPAKTRK